MTSYKLVRLIQVGVALENRSTGDSREVKLDNINVECIIYQVSTT